MRWGSRRLGFTSIVALIVALVATLSIPAPAGAVVDGEPADIDEYPWTVALVEPGEAPIDGQFCGGSLVAPQWVLTAAHCVSGGRGRPMAPTKVDVLLGRADLRRHGGERVDVAEVRIDPARVDPDLDIDVALLRLAHPVHTATIALAPAGQPDPPAGTDAEVLGWGVTRRGNDREVDRGYSSDVLRVATVPVVGDGRCRRLTDASSEEVDGFELCAGDLSGHGGDSCLGDSGGPLVVDTVEGPMLIGVVAWSAKGCGLARNPGVYTRVASATDWIQQTIATAPPA